MGQLYTAQFTATAVTAQVDLFELNVASTKAVRIHRCVIGQSSDPGDAQAEMLGITFVRGYTTSGSGGSAPTPQKLATGLGAAATTVETLNTTLATGGTASVLEADAFNVAVGYRYQPAPEERIELAPSERLVIRLGGAPADSLTMSGTLVFEEIG